MDGVRTILETRDVARAMGSVDEVTATDGTERFAIAPDTRSIPRSFDLLVRGWIADDSTKTRARAVRAFVDDRPRDVRYGYSRADVAAATGHADLEFTGYRIGLDLAEMELGTHVLRIVAEDANGKLIGLDAIEFEIVQPIDGDDASPAPFALAIDDFRADFEHPLGGWCVERGNVAVLRGSLRDVQNGEGAAEIFGVLDRFEMEPAQGGFTHASDAPGRTTGFLLCLPTLDLALGTHELHLVARSVHGHAQRFGPLEFTVTPVACDLASPVASVGNTEAELWWIDAADPTANVQRRLTRDEVVHLQGWAIDAQRKDAVGEAFVAFENGLQFGLLARQYRPNIARNRDVPNALYCGLVGSIAIAHFAPGRHTGCLFVRAKDDQTYMKTRATVQFEVVEHAS